MTNIVRILEDKKIAYAVLKGDHECESLKKEDIVFREDLDIVLDCVEEDILPFLKANNSFKYLQNNSFLSISDNLRIDLYFKTLNVGYYHFLKIRDSSFRVNKVSDDEYLIYQMLDPLLKFSKYQRRHEYRLSHYFKEGVSNNVQINLNQIIGRRLAKILLNRISDSKYFMSRLFIKRCKIRLLFINGNFVRMMKSRFF